MTEILGSNLEQFFKNSKLQAKCTYKQDKPRYNYDELYEIWEVSDDVFKAMCDLSEDEFMALCPNDNAWWRGRDNSCTPLEASIMGSPGDEYIINGHKIMAWDGQHRIDYEEDQCAYCPDKADGRCAYDDPSDCYGKREYKHLKEYFHEEMSISTESNIHALLHDLAMYNHMSMSELLNKCN